MAEQSSPDSTSERLTADGSECLDGQTAPRGYRLLASRREAEKFARECEATAVWLDAADRPEAAAE